MQDKVQISASVFLLLPMALLLLPLRWVLAWVLAVIIHETGHYLALRFCRIPVDGIFISHAGVTMHTAALQNGETIICALAGPLFALLFTTLSKFIPCTAVCILVQSLFNLLPIYPLDGGRALRGFLTWLLSYRWAMWLENGILAAVMGILLHIICDFHLGILPTLAIVGIFLQKSLANQGNTRYNRGEKHF